MYVKVTMDVEIGEDVSIDGIDDVLKQAMKGFELDKDVMIMSVDVINNDTDEVIVTTF